MPDRFDDARRALEEVPAPDLWAEASRRADAGTVVPLPDGVARGRRSRRWLAVAAVAALAVGTAALVARHGEDDQVDAGPSAPRAEPDGLTLFTAGRCPFAISGEAVVEATGEGVTPTPDAVQLELGTAQRAYVQVPAELVRDFGGERLEDVELARGRATLWFRPEGVEVRWTGAEGGSVCDSFSVAVGSATTPGATTEDEDRHAAVDLADRIVLADELPVGDDLLAGDWQLERSTLDGDPTAGGGLRFSFAGGEAGWSDGCNSYGARYLTTGEDTVRVYGSIGTLVGCIETPTSAAVADVMGAPAVHVSHDGDLLVLTAGGVELRLRPLVPSGPPPAAQRFEDRRWKVVELERDGADVSIGQAGSDELVLVIDGADSRSRTSSTP